MNYNSNITIYQYNVDLCDFITPVLSIVAWGNKYPKEVGASNECNSSRHIRKNILWFSPDLGFHVKHWCTVYVYDCSFVHCLFTLQLLDDNASLI